MPRKPNYRYERYERDRLKAEKKAARAAAKAERKAQENPEAAPDSDGTEAVETTDAENPETGTV